VTDYKVCVSTPPKRHTERRLFKVRLWGRNRYEPWP